MTNALGTLASHPGNHASNNAAFTLFRFIRSSQWACWDAVPECQTCAPSSSVSLHSRIFEIEIVTHLGTDPSPKLWDMYFSRLELGRVHW